MGRPRFVEGETRRPYSVSLGESEIQALRELAEVLDTSQGIACGKAITDALKREKRKHGK